jgi:uncharacterized protein
MLPFRRNGLMVRQSLSKKEKQQILNIAQTHGAKRVMLFGSYARGEVGPESDLDILVELAPTRTLLDIVAIKQDVEDLLGMRVDVVTTEGVSPHLKKNILQEAVLL